MMWSKISNYDLTNRSSSEVDTVRAGHHRQAVRSGQHPGGVPQHREQLSGTENPLMKCKKSTRIKIFSCFNFDNKIISPWKLRHYCERNCGKLERPWYSIKKKYLPVLRYNRNLWTIYSIFIRMLVKFVITYPKTLTANKSG